MSAMRLADRLAGIVMAETDNPDEAITVLCSALAAVADLALAPEDMLTSAIALLLAFRDGQRATDAGSSEIPLERIELACAQLGAEHEPSADWQDDVLAQIDREDKS